MNTTTNLKLLMTPSYRQRSLIGVASLLITLAVMAANLQLAQGYADVGATRAQSAQASAPERV